MIIGTTQLNQSLELAALNWSCSNSPWISITLFITMASCQRLTVHTLSLAIGYLVNRCSDRGLVAVPTPFLTINPPEIEAQHTQFQPLTSGTCRCRRSFSPTPTPFIYARKRITCAKSLVKKWSRWWFNSVKDILNNQIQCISVIFHISNWK